MLATADSDFERQLPHRPPMLMLTRMLDRDKDRVHCISVIEAQNPLLRDGLFPVACAVELLAQAAGTLLGSRRPDHAVRPGAIVQIKSFQVAQADIRVGAELQIHARYQAGTAEAALFQGEVTFGELCIFSGELMIALLPGERT